MAKYPPYNLKIEGLGVNHKMTGTHAGALVTSNPKIKVKFELQHEDSGEPFDGQPAPNLIIKVSEVNEE